MGFISLITWISFRMWYHWSKKNRNLKEFFAEKLVKNVMLYFCALDKDIDILHTKHCHNFYALIWWKSYFDLYHDLPTRFFNQLIRLLIFYSPLVQKYVLGKTNFPYDDVILFCYPGNELIDFLVMLFI